MRPLVDRTLPRVHTLTSCAIWQEDSAAQTHAKLGSSVETVASSSAPGPGREEESGDVKLGGLFQGRL